jgi:hypothetical protein
VDRRIFNFVLVQENRDIPQVFKWLDGRLFRLREAEPMVQRNMPTYTCRKEA